MPLSSSVSNAARSFEALAQLARLFKIVTLVASPATSHALGRKELANLCECSVRTIQRDLALLAEAGIPIDYDVQRRLYRFPNESWTFPVASFNAADALALALLRGIATAPGLPQGEALRETLSKLTSSLPPALSALMQDAGHLVQWGTPTRDYSAAPLAGLQEAAHRRRTVEIDYESRSRAERSWRRVDPYVVEARAGQFWEVHGWCHRNSAIRTFALDQVFGMKETEAGFDIRDLEWAAFSAARGVIGGIRGKEAVEVNVVFTPPVAVYAKGQRWPDGLTVTQEPDGMVRLTGTVAGVSGLVTELLRWRRYCRVEGGSVLRARMMEEVRAMAALYDKEQAASSLPTSSAVSENEKL